MILIEVCIGMVFLFLVLSLLATAIQEMIATFLQLRGQKLFKALRGFIESEQLSTVKQGELFQQFINHPLYKQLCRRDYDKKQGKTIFHPPAYIEPETFAEIITAILATNQDGKLQLDIQQFKQTLESWTADNNKDFKDIVAFLLLTADEDINKFRQNLSNWYNNTMNKVSGWYKRSTQIMLFFIGLVLSVGLNVNSIYTTEYLLNNDAERNLVVAQATATTIADSKAKMLLELTDTTLTSALAPDKKLDSLINGINSLFETDAQPLINHLNLGWSAPTRAAIYEKFEQADSKGKAILLFTMLLGWLISALAISLGAPFWFDLLSQLVNIRGTGQALFVQKNTPTPQQPANTITIKTGSQDDSLETRKKPVG